MVKHFEWLLKAAEAGYGKVYGKVGQCYREGNGVIPNKAKALYWFRKAAEVDETDAHARLLAFLILDAGGDGVAVEKKLKRR